MKTVCLAWFGRHVSIIVVDDWPSYIEFLVRCRDMREPDRLEVRQVTHWGGN